MPTIGIWVDEETKRIYDALNKHPQKVGSKAVKELLKILAEAYAPWIRGYEALQRGEIIPLQTKPVIREEYREILEKLVGVKEEKEEKLKEITEISPEEVLAEISE